MSHDLVSIVAEGGVVTKPALSYTKRGTTMCKFGLLCSVWRKQSGTKEKEGMYFTVTTLGKTAETIYPMLKVGMPVRVEGEYLDGVYRDKLTDEPKVGRCIWANRVKSFVFWHYRSISQKKQDEADRINALKIGDNIDLESLPF